MYVLVLFPAVYPSLSLISLLSTSVSSLTFSSHLPSFAHACFFRVFEMQLMPNLFNDLGKLAGLRFPPSSFLQNSPVTFCIAVGSYRHLCCERKCRTLADWLA